MARSRSRRVGPGNLAGRALSLLAFLPVASRAPVYARLVLALVRDGRVPAPQKLLLAGAAGYVLLGQDLIPDDIPIVGGIDDLLVVLIAVETFLDGVPEPLLTEKLFELGIDRAAYDRDLAQIRRIVPRPLRRVLREVPRVLGSAAEMVAHSGLGARLRTMVSKEGSVA